MNRLLSICISSMCLFLISCGGNGKADNTKEALAEGTDTASGKDPDLETMSGKQMKAVGIEMGVVETKNLTSVVRAGGQLKVPPQNRAVVNVLVGGVIQRINVVEGQHVQKGQVVAAIENPEFIRLQQDYLTSKDNIVYLGQEFERQKQLKEADAGIGKIYQQASANYAAEKSKLLTLEKQLQQIHIDPSHVAAGKLVTQVPVLAPISGTVGHITSNVGTYTDAASPIMDIVDNSKIFADLLIYDKDIASVKTGQKVHFSSGGRDMKEVSGVISGINKSLETENKAVIAHAVINNPSSLNLIAGSYVSALIDVGQQTVRAIPKDAVVNADNKKFVFVLQEITGDSIYVFRKTEVATGAEELGYAELRTFEELPGDQKIVTKGAFYIYSKMQDLELDE